MQCLCPIRDCSHLTHCHCIVPVVSVYLICIARQRQTAETVSTLSALLAAGRGKSGIRLLAWTREVLMLPGYQINTLRPWLFLSFKVLGLEELCIFLHLNIFWDCGKSWTLKWISDDPHLMGLILTDGRRLETGGGQEMLKWTYSLEYYQQTLSPVSPLL